MPSRRPAQGSRRCDRPGSHRFGGGWDDKQQLLMPYGDCSLCNVCKRCDFTLRDDAKYFVDQMFLKDKALLKDRQALFSKLVPMGKRLKEMDTGYAGARLRQLLYCVGVRYIRKAALETPAILSHTETERTLHRMLSEFDALAQHRPDGREVTDSMDFWRK